MLGIYQALRSFQEQECDSRDAIGTQKYYTLLELA
jgi:hypothetical protein